MKYFKQFLELFKSLFKIGKQTTKLDSLLDQIDVGDIIWAKRYETKEEKKLIPEGHLEGPSIVLDKCDKGLVCSPGTSVYHENEISKYFELDNLDYRLMKKTFFRLSDLRIIDNKTFIKKLDRLKEEDMKSLLRQLKISRNNYYKIDGEKHKIFVELDVGDIINKVFNYLIIDIVDNKFLCIPIKQTNTDLKYNLKFDYFRNLDYSKVTLIDNNEDIKYLNSASSNSLLFVLKKQKEYVEHSKNQKITQRGSVINKDNKYYYVYGEEGPDWLVFEISKLKSQKLDVIIINNKKFYTDYKNKTINKEENFNTLSLATSSEIDEIKEKRKEYIKSHKDIKINEAISKIDKVETIKLEYNKKVIINGEEYIISEIIGNMIGCMNKGDIVLPQRKLKYFNINNVKIEEVIEEKVLKK
ncbi:MAG: hypothetical protein E7174_04745 [Firmicutes bacterium]|nr:hypothetical protein [Bacillota bacterium]